MLLFHFKPTLRTALLPITCVISFTPLFASAQASVPSDSSVTGQSGSGSNAAKPFRISTAYDAAIARLPEVQSLSLRKQALAAQRDAANKWSPELPAIALSASTDRLGGNAGGRDYGVALSVPLWLEGERNSSRALAEVQSKGLEASLLALKLKAAAGVREAYWALYRGQVEFALAKDRLKNAQTLATDVSKRLKAGDLARSDQHQADGNVAAAEGTVAESEQHLMGAQSLLKSLSGYAPDLGTITTIDQMIEALPPINATLNLADDQSHPELNALQIQGAIAKQSARLSTTQSKPNSELTVGLNRDRGSFGEPYQNKLNVGIRIAFGSDTRNIAKALTANAEALEIETQIQLSKARLNAEIEAAQQKVLITQRVLNAFNKRANLAKDTRGFFDKSFRLGETDLPTRLRVELELTEADRQVSRARIDYAAAVSALRQALGLLPQ